MLPSIFLIQSASCAYLQGFLKLSLTVRDRWGSGDVFICGAFANFAGCSFLRCSSVGGATSHPLLAVQQQLPSYPSPEYFHTRSLCCGILYRSFCPDDSGEEQFAGAWVKCVAGERCSTSQVLDPLAHSKPSQCIQVLDPAQCCSAASVMHPSFF